MILYAYVLRETCKDWCYGLSSIKFYGIKILLVLLFPLRHCFNCSMLVSFFSSIFLKGEIARCLTFFISKIFFDRYRVVYPK